MNFHPENYLIFTYGTLKRGFPNHSLIEEINGSYRGDATTKFKYPLLLAGKWCAPFLIHHKNYPGSYSIKGELFEVNENGLTKLDAFEGVKNNYYKRLKIDVFYETENGHSTPTEAWCYFRYGNSAHLLDSSFKFLSFYGSEELEKYTPVHLRPSDWKESI